jgi:signal transduction histidine kinase/integral membrane sensor domain MASE1
MIRRLGSGPGIAATAALVFVAYLLGAKLGTQLRFLPITTSVLWPPNAILTATLLLTPVRRWWVYLLLGALPAHVIVQSGAGFPVPLMLALFVTNCSEALLAAAGVRRFGRAARFDTLRNVAVFVAYAVLAAPFLSSFADAAVVATFRDEPYWLIWRTRFFANVLTELMLVPGIVLAVTHGWPWFRSAPPRRLLEAALLTAAPVIVGAVVFGHAFDHFEGLRESPGAQVAFLLPVLLWGAVRFGPAGFSFTLLLTTLVAIWVGSRAGGPFGGLPPAESVLSFQIFLSVVGIPLLFLAAVLEERQRAQAALAERLRFEELLSQLSSSFVHLSASLTDSAVATWLGQLGRFLNVDCVVLYRLPADSGDPRVVQAWTAPAVEGARATAPLGAEHAWVVRELRAERPVTIAGRDGLPPALHLPLVAGGGVLGGLSFLTLSAARAWPPELVQRLGLVAEVFASALAQRDAGEAIRASETLKSAILASLTSGVAVLDREGCVVAVNRAWTRFGEEPAAWGAHAGVGASYVERCRAAAVAGRTAASDVIELIRAVLGGGLPTFTLEYGGGEHSSRWFTISVVPLTGMQGGAVVSHADVTEVKRAEIEAQRVRQQLSHSARVSTMGELTASLAHELNQPLTGIMTNAQAAQRFLESTPPDYREIRSILADIVDDDRRAAEVIHRLRELMRKGEPESMRLDLNEVVRDVLKLVGSDAIIRRITLTSDAAPGPLTVIGDRVQLQQLLLNLLINAMEAISDADPGERVVAVRTRSTERAVEVFVEDTGSGLAPGAEGLIFEPFYTTKASGMGMGLSIARSIVQAHGGAIWTRNNPSRGATFHFALPRVEQTVP